MRPFIFSAFPLPEYIITRLYSGGSPREFLRTSAVLAAASALGAASPLTAASRKRSIGANDPIRIGIIGCGDRGCTAHMTGITCARRENQFRNRGAGRSIEQIARGSQFFDDNINAIRHKD